MISNQTDSILLPVKKGRYSTHLSVLIEQIVRKYQSFSPEIIEVKSKIKQLENIESKKTQITVYNHHYHSSPFKYRAHNIESTSSLPSTFLEYLVTSITTCATQYSLMGDKIKVESENLIIKSINDGNRIITKIAEHSYQSKTRTDIWAGEYLWIKKLDKNLDGCLDYGVETTATLCEGMDFDISEFACPDVIKKKNVNLDKFKKFL